MVGSLGAFGLERLLEEGGTEQDRNGQDMT